MRVISEIMRFQSERGLDKQKFEWYNEVMNITEELLEAKGYDVPKQQRYWLKDLAVYIRAKTAGNAAVKWLRPSKHDTVDAFADIIVFCVGAIMKLGFDPEIVLQEVAKEINSREGKMVNGKFEKDLSDTAKAKWYKASFTKAQYV